MYYIKKNEKIELYDTDKQRLINTLPFRPELKDLDILETQVGYTILNNEIVTDEYAKEVEQKQEQERINNITMTALDFIKSLQTLGLTLEQINTYLENNLEVKMQLTYCQNVYCGVVKQLCPISFGEIEITSEMIEELFKKKDEEKE